MQIDKIREFGDVREFLGETTVSVSREKLMEALSWLRYDAGYGVLTDLSGVDYLEPEAGTLVFYWLQNPETYARIRITHFVRREEKIPSVVSLWGGANWYERELYDLFGVLFEDHPSLTRILMPDDWIGHPLRKDYPLTEERVEFKHGVKPKIPSRTIPYVK